MDIPLLVKLSLVCPMGDLNVRVLLGRPGIGEEVRQTQLLAFLLKLLQEGSSVVCLHCFDQKGKEGKAFLQEQSSIPGRLGGIHPQHSLLA